MPIQFATSLELDLLHARWWGRVSFDEFKATFAAYLDDENYKPGRRELIDVGGLEDFDIDFARARAMLRIVNSQSPAVQVKTQTVIWSPNEEIYGLGRMYQQIAELADGIEVQIFHHQKGALAALDLSYPSFGALLERYEFLPAKPRGGIKTAL
ncbi:MAG: hypothetical protein AAFN09_16815 [Pseudomonadota bacterium]